MLILNSITRLYNAFLNKRNIITLPLNFAINFSPIFIWLFIFHHAGIIPIDWRPPIHSKWAFYMDVFLFGDFAKELITQLSNPTLYYTTFFTSAVFLMFPLILLPLSIWYYIYYIKKYPYNVIEHYNHYFLVLSNNESSSYNKLEEEENHPSPNLHKLSTLIIPFAVPLITFFILTADHFQAAQTEDNFTNFKDYLAWTFYVILHVTAPILTAIYLHVFHPPGTLKSFSFALGLQNLFGVSTHLLLPMAPPWFIHLYGINDTDHVTYQQQGYAAGLTRVDKHLGTHLNTNGFHMSPIVFGAVPSIHSAIAFQCFIFIIARATRLKHRFSTHKPVSPETTSKDSIELEPLVLQLSQSSASSFSSHIEQDESSSEQDQKHDFIKLYTEDPAVSNKWYIKPFNYGWLPVILVTLFITVQLWTTMYLDHHFRFDLFVGMLYALASFIVINKYIQQPQVMRKFIWTRLGKIPDDDNEGRTFGMRVFQGTKYEWFFDPLA